MAAYTYPGGQNGQCLMVDNINFLFDSAQTTLENGINIVKLQYCNSLTDIDHDYMVVDVFTDSNGYNDTIDITTNCCTYNTFTPETICCCTSGNADCLSISMGCFYISSDMHSSRNTCGNNQGYYCIYDCFDISDYSYFCFNVVHFRRHCATCQKTSMSSFFNTTISNFSINCTCSFAGSGIQCSNCYNCCVYNIVGKKIGDNWHIFANDILSEIYCCNYFPKITQCYVGCVSTTGDSFHPRSCDFSCMCVGCFCFKKYETNSEYNLSQLNGYYSNEFKCCSGVPKSCLLTGTIIGFINNDYAIGTAGNCCGRSAADLQMCVSCYYTDFSKVTEFGFNLLFCGYMLSGSYGFACLIISTDCWQDSYCIDCSTCLPGINLATTRCYKYLKTSENCWDFYCNGVYKCAITLCNFPNICNRVYYSGSYVCRNTVGYICMTCAYNVVDNLCTKILTLPIEYTNPIITSYLKTDHTGTGSIAYNVYDATTDTLIGENLAPNTLNTLTSCVDCHYYEIVQCSDGVSCIKSYALAAGQA